jgi:hypothetical protein
MKIIADILACIIVGLLGAWLLVGGAGWIFPAVAP